MNRRSFTVIWQRPPTGPRFPTDPLHSIRVATTAVLAQAQLLQRRCENGTLSPDQLARGIDEVAAAAKRLAQELANLDRTTQG